LRFSVIKTLSYCIIFTAFMLKLPQLVKILSNGSVKGLSKFSAYADFVSYFNCLAYARHLSIAFHSFGEVILITVQNAAIVLCFYRYDK